MAILPVYTTSKLHAARINLKHLAQQLGYRSIRKRAWFLVGSGRGLQKIFAPAQARPALRTPLHEILDPPLPCQLTLLQCSFQILAYLKSFHSRCVDKNVNILLLFTANTVNTVTTAISVNSTFCVLTCGKYHNCIHDMPSVTKLCFPNYFIQHGVTLLTIHKTYDHTL